MKAMYKYELAKAAGVSTRTLVAYLNENKANIEKDVGIRILTNAKLLPPNVVKWVCEHYCIEI